MKIYQKNSKVKRRKIFPPSYSQDQKCPSRKKSGTGKNKCVPVVEWSYNFSTRENSKIARSLFSQNFKFVLYWRKNHKNQIFEIYLCFITNFQKKIPFFHYEFPKIPLCFITNLQKIPLCFITNLQKIPLCFITIFIF